MTCNVFGGFKQTTTVMLAFVVHAIATAAAVAGDEARSGHVT